jgi:hypothetical protein
LAFLLLFTPYRSKMKCAVVLLFMSIFILPCLAQNYDPLTLSRKIFSKDTLPNIKKYSTGDYEGRPNGRDFKAGLEISFELLNQTGRTAVVAVTLTDSAGMEFNTYMHFAKDSIWKVSGFRALAMTGIIEQVYREISALNPRQVDSVLLSPHNKKTDRRMFKSRREYLYTLGNTKLTLSSDKDLIAHFNKNRAQFERLKNELTAKGIYKSNTGTRDMKGIDNINQELRNLFIDGVHPNPVEVKDGLDFLIGGILDNAVGYIYVNHQKDVPEMSPNHFIMIRSLGGGWYLYKTT